MAVDLEMLIKAKAILGTAQAEIQKFLGSVEDQTDKLNKTSEKTGTNIGAYFKGGFMIAGAAATAFAGTVLAVGAAVAALGQRGAAIDDTRGSFAQLTAEVGGSAASIATLRQATDGVVTDFDLMDRTNKAFSLGLRLTQDQLSLTGETARVLADRVGVDVADAYGTLTMAMATGNDRLLKTVGLNIDAKAAVDAYAKSLGVEANELNENQQILAKRTAILAAMRGELEASGGAEADFADRIDQVRVVVQNFNDNLSVAIATSPVLNELLGFTADAIMGAFGDNQQDSIAAMVGWINKFAIMVVDAAQVTVSFGKFAGQAFYGVRTIVFSVLGAITDFGLTVTDLQLKMVSAASKIPGVGAAFKGFGDQLRGQRAELQGISSSFHETAEQALTDAAKWGTGADNINGKLGELRLKMVSLDRQGVSGAAIQENLAKHFTKTGDAAGVTNKQVEQFEKNLRQLTTAAETAAKNGRLEQWAERNASAINKLAAEAADLGRTIDGTLFEAFRKAQIAAANQDAAKRAVDILKEQAEEYYKTIDRQNEKFLKGLDIRGEAEREALNLSAQRTLSDYEYKKFLIEQEEADKIRELESVGQATEENLEAVRSVTAEKMAAAAKAHNEEIAKMKAATNSWGNLTQKWLASVPETLKAAFTGGGGVSGALKGLFSGMGGDIGDKLFGGPNGIGNKLAQGLLGKGASTALAGTVGKFAGMLGGPLGSILGGVAGSVIGKLFGGDKDTKQIKELSKQMTELYGGIDSIRALSKATGVDMEAAFKNKGKKGLEEFQKQAEKFKEKLSELKKEFGEWGDEAVRMGVRLPASLTPYLAQLEKMGLLTKEHADSLRNLAENGTVNIEAVKAAADRYGVSIAALGPAFQQGVANQNWQQVIDDLRLFKDSGADINAVLADMSDEISKLVQDSIAFGTTIPENMRPYVEKLIESGQLLDESGNKITDISKLTFGDKLVESVEKIVARLDTLLQGLGLVPRAIDAIPDQVNVDVNFRTNGMPEVPEGIAPGEYNPNGEMPELPGAAAGGLFASPAFRVVAEREPEIVGAPNVIVSALAAAMKETGMAGKGGGGNSVVFNVETPIATVDSIRQMVYQEIGPVLIDWLNDNRGGSRTEVQRALGLETT